MLKKIVCNKFIVSEINFNENLNILSGDNIGSNSIGKTTFLMIIDFVFGGNSYTTVNRDVIQHIGHHTINFIFKFDDNDFYFSRTTFDIENVSVCDKDFNTIEKISRKKYCSWLQEKYRCKLYSLSFRNIVGRYFRIYGKENLSEKKPLEYTSGEPTKTEILNLVKLFNRYEPLASTGEEIKELAEKETLLNKVNAHNIVQFPTKKGSYTQNKKEIKTLSEELEMLKKEIQKNTTDIETILSSELLDYQEKKENINIEITRRKNRIKRIERNLLVEKNIASDEFNEIVQYFSTINLEKLSEIDNFHIKLTKILRKNLLKELRITKKELNFYMNDLVELQKDIDIVLESKNISSLPVNRILEINSELDKLTYQNEMYENKFSISQDKRKLKNSYTEAWTTETDEISNAINIQMAKFNEKIYPSGRQSPIFNLHQSSYTFKTPNDTGTGTAFVNLIMFDLSILILTVLPALVHDLPLFKNIENNAFEQILKSYTSFNKQIFIAIDKCSSYTSTAQKIIGSNTVLKLSKENTLFNRSWKHEK